MSREFDILYDNIASHGAPGLNNYEKSVILTKAQEELVKETYGPFNLPKIAFEGSEKRRRSLNELVKSYSNSAGFSSEFGLSSSSLFFEIPSDVFYIIQEEIVVTSTDVCMNGSTLGVIPITHDEYNVQKKSPFRKPNKRKAWRLDISEVDDKKVVEIISVYTPNEYKMRYVKKPLPIILSDFDTDPELIGLSLTVDNLNTITQCELNPEIHRDIINRAVELAIKGYRENTLQSNVELNKRNV